MRVMEVIPRRWLDKETTGKRKKQNCGGGGADKGKEQFQKLVFSELSPVHHLDSRFVKRWLSATHRHKSHILFVSTWFE